MDSPVTFPPGLGDQPTADRIAVIRHDDGDGGRGARGGMGRLRRPRHDDVDLEAHQLGRQLGEPLVSPIGVSALDAEVPALHVPELAQPLEERVPQARPGRGRRGRAEEADPVHLARRPGVGGERRGQHRGGEPDHDGRVSDDHDGLSLDPLRRPGGRYRR
jgi:hypothetical protein